MADLGKVVITDGGNYSTSVTYEKLTFVHYQGDTYMTLKTVKGVTPTDDGVNYRLFCKSAELATATKTGIVMPDGTTTAIDNSGKISVKKATTSAAGIVKPATSDFVVASDGTQTINKSFSQASSLSNISTSDSWLTMMGKIAKSIATTISLNTNALLKSAMSGIDANDANKVPNSAFIHTLVERIGMGTNLVSGLNNLTAGLNSVKQQVDQQNSDLTLALDGYAVRRLGYINPIKAGLIEFDLSDKFSFILYAEVHVNNIYSTYTVNNWSREGTVISARVSKINNPGIYTDGDAPVVEILAVGKLK